MAVAVARCLDDLNAFACEDGVEVAGELAVAVADQESKRRWLLLERVGCANARLVERGLLREESGKILGTFPTHHWPANDAAHENSARVLLVDALRLGATDDDRAGALISLLHALKRVEKVIDPSTVGVTKRELKANAKHVAEGDWASEAVRSAIDQMIGDGGRACGSSQPRLPTDIV